MSRPEKPGHILIYAVSDLESAFDMLKASDATIIALNPDVFVACVKAGIITKPANLFFNDRDHVRTAWHRRRLFKQIHSLLYSEQSLLKPHEAMITLRLLLKYHSDIWKARQILAKTLQPALLVKGKLVCFESKKECLHSFLNMIYTPTESTIDKVNLNFSPPPLVWLFRALRAIYIRILLRRFKWVCSSSQKLSSELVINMLGKAPSLRHAAIINAFDDWRNYPFLLKEIFRFASGKKRNSIAIPVFHDYIPSQTHSRISGALCQLIKKLYDEDLKQFCSTHGEALLNPIISSAVLETDIETVLKQLKPRACITYDMNQVSVASMHYVAKNNDIRSIVVNHNPFSQRNQLSKAVMGQLAFLRATPYLADEIVVLSADTYKHLKSDPIFKQTKIKPIRPTYRQEVPQAKKPLLLHAGSVAGWTQFFPGIIETPFEFLFNIKEICNVMAPIKTADLEIRLKHRGDINLSVVKDFLPTLPDHIKLTNTDIPFAKHLKNATLLISYHSTCVEEALREAIPVLLYGPTERFMQLNASDTPPTENKRSAIYYANTPEKLAQMLPAIIKFHTGKPLSTDELADYLFNNTIESVDSYAQQLLEKLDIGHL